jgi:hypothetical protein
MFGILDGIDIPAGEKEYIKRNTFTVPTDLDAFRVNAHAHYLGKRMEMTATFPDGRKEWLLKMSDWNFAWQEDYQFKKPVRLPAGTKIDVLISWDNSATNPHQANHPPKPVRWGPAIARRNGNHHPLGHGRYPGAERRAPSIGEALHGHPGACPGVQRGRDHHYSMRGRAGSIFRTARAAKLQEIAKSLDHRSRRQAERGESRPASGPPSSRPT